MVNKSGTQSLTDQLAQRFAQRIRDRLLGPGARLPSVRQCAQQQGLSPSTVVGAYDQLLAQGLVEARNKRGFFVRELRTTALSPSAAIRADALRPEWAPLSAAALIRGMFQHSNGKAHPSMGVLPPDWLQTTFLSAAVRRHSSAAALNSFSLQYGEPQGDTSLRQALAQQMETLAIGVAPSQIITTLGATHALDIVSRTLLRAGDYVMVEEPGWAVEFARLEALGMRILPVPRRADGPDLDVMARYCQAHSPKLFVSVSVLHNPTGFCLSPSAAHQTLQLAQQHDFHIVEDDTYCHLAAPHATRLCALDNLKRTIYVSGFAKILAPNWRVGFLAAPPELVERLLDTKLLSTLTTPALLERAMASCIDQGQLRRHAERVRSRLGVARSRSVAQARAHGIRFASEPAGLFGWVDTGVDTDALAHRMLDEGYLLAPGALFHAVRAPSQLMRINFAITQEPTFWQVLCKVRDTM